MTEPRQKSIGITPREKDELTKAKKLYEQRTGEKTDWGRFLGLISALGLAALGIYKLTKASKANLIVECPECGMRFPIAHTGDLGSITHITCPECSEEVVVNLSD